MRRSSRSTVKRLWLGALLCLATVHPLPACAGGVTVITHGYDGDVTGWIAAMADEIPSYYHAYRYPGGGTNFTIYTLKLTTDGSNYYYQWSRDSGGSPTNTDTGEIIVKLDWSQMAGSPTDPSVYDISTYTVAAVASYVLLQTNAIADLNGHALAEYPVHLIGHSRGGSLMSQLAYVLGTNGVWVDQLTTLDPHPLNNDGNDDYPLAVVDAPVHVYANVLYADDYWQNEGFFLDPHGEAVSGAYVRQLSAGELSGGYQNTSSISPDHSNVHLWYYGTLSLNVPATYDDDGESVTIDGGMRTNWWVPYEQHGAVGGFFYSLIGSGNRLSADHPLGLPSEPAIVDGYNQYWDIGAGSNTNRTVLPANNGSWPNLIKFNLAGTNAVIAGNLARATLYYQYAGAATNLTLQIYFDQDLNPLNSNSVLVAQMQPLGTGASSVNEYADLGLATTNIPPGRYAVYGKISGGLHTRYLYAPELLQIVAGPTAVMSIRKLTGSQLVIGVNGVGGENIVLQSSTDLRTWQPLATNTLAGGGWNYTNSLPSNPGGQFYRVLLSP
jgi:hypothetical protein